MGVMANGTLGLADIRMHLGLQKPIFKVTFETECLYGTLQDHIGIHAFMWMMAFQTSPVLCRPMGPFIGFAKLFPGVVIMTLGTEPGPLLK